MTYCIFVSLRSQFVNFIKQHVYVPSWSWKSPSPDSLRCSVEQPTERPSLTGERRTRLLEVRLRHCEVQRSGSLWLDRFQSQMDLPSLVEGFSLDVYWTQCGGVTATPQGYLKYTDILIRFYQ